MGEINPVCELLKDNPKTSITDLKIYADALKTYIEADKNIVKNGAVCQHPRTGAPIENPYLKIRISQSVILLKMPRVRGEKLQKLLMEND